MDSSKVFTTLIRHFLLHLVWSCMCSLMLACGAAHTQNPRQSGAHEPVPNWEESTQLEPVWQTTTSFPELAHARLTLIDFWASWCEPCKELVPELKALHSRYLSSDFQVVGVNVGEDREVAKQFAKEAGIPYPVYADPEFAFADRIGARKVPTFALMDQTGKIIDAGRAPNARTHTLIERYLHSPNQR